MIMTIYLHDVKDARLIEYLREQTNMCAAARLMMYYYMDRPKTYIPIAGVRDIASMPLPNSAPPTAAPKPPVVDAEQLQIKTPPMFKGLRKDSSGE